MIKSIKNSFILEYQAVIDGKLPLSQAHESTQSAFRLHLFLEAQRILELPKADRLAQIMLAPESYREELKESVRQVHEVNKQSAREGRIIYLE
jgi:hypothetical protein